MEKQQIDRLWAWGIAICIMLLFMQLHDIMLRDRQRLYDAGYKAGVESAEEEDEDEGSDFIGEDYQWKV